MITRAAASAAALFRPPLVLFFFSNLMFETMSVSRYNGDTPRGLEVFAMKKNAMNPHRLAVLAMMTAVVFAVNFPSITIPLPTGETSFTLANIACVPVSYTHLDVYKRQHHDIDTIERMEIIRDLRLGLSLIHI